VFVRIGTLACCLRSSAGSSRPACRGWIRARRSSKLCRRICGPRRCRGGRTSRCCSKTSYGPRSRAPSSRPSSCSRRDHRSSRHARAARGTRPCTTRQWRAHCRCSTGFARRASRPAASRRRRSTRRRSRRRRWRPNTGGMRPCCGCASCTRAPPSSAPPLPRTTRGGCAQRRVRAAPRRRVSCSGGSRGWRRGRRWRGRAARSWRPRPEATWMCCVSCCAVAAHMRRAALTLPARRAARAPWALLRGRRTRAGRSRRRWQQGTRRPPTFCTRTASPRRRCS